VDDQSHRGGPGLTLDRIVRTAIGIADAEGLAALSMRRVARALGAGAMSLYRYVPSRAELVALMVEAVFGEIRYPDPGPDDWRARVEFVARQEWEMYRRHPWVLAIVAGTRRPPLGPNVLATVEWVLEAIDGYGLAPPVAAQIYLMVSDYVQGAALYVRTEVEAERASGLSAEQWWSAEEPVLVELLRSGRFPRLARLYAQAPGASWAVGKDFEFGLRRVLDGIAVFLAETAGKPGIAEPACGPEPVGGRRAAPPGPEPVPGRSPEPLEPERTRLQKTTELSDPLPPATSAVLEMLSRRWTADVLLVLGRGEARFRDLVRAVPGVSRRVLTERLRELADAGLVTRRVAVGPPTRIGYALTPRGAGLARALAPIHDWANRDAARP
jgi:Predicted transcriptional regulators